MSIVKDIHNEKAKLVKATFANKLGKKITSDILMPILNQLEQDVPIIMENAAQWMTQKVTDFLHSVSPSGRTYEIWELDSSAPRGQKARKIAEYTASGEGQPPAMLTGTLSESIEYEMFSDGSFKVGLLKSWEEYSDAKSEFESAFFAGGKIFVGKDYNTSWTPVGTYGRYLESKFRPWFRGFMNDHREELRQKIRTDVRKSLNKITRRISVRRAIVFKVYFT